MPTQQVVQTYLTSLRQIVGAPNATEHSYRSAIETLIKDLAQHLNRPLAHLTLEPGHVTAVGAPDAILYGSTDQDLIGYLETKDLGKDLDNLSGHDLQQFNRYRAGLTASLARATVFYQGRFRCLTSRSSMIQPASICGL
jgi:hypothetical protein